MSTKREMTDEELAEWLADREAEKELSCMGPGERPDGDYEDGDGTEQVKAQ